MSPTRQIATENPLEKRRASAQEKKYKALEYAVAQLRAEIGQFWRISLFFWGFSAASFVGYGVLIDKHKILAVAMAAFGLICSVAWTLANRGNKYWYGLWLKKVQAAEQSALGTDVFVALDDPNPQPGWWGAWRYSVTMLAIALSDFAVLVWVTLLLTAAKAAAWAPEVLGILIVTAVYAAKVLYYARARRPSKHLQRQSATPGQRT